MRVALEQIRHVLDDPCRDTETLKMLDGRSVRAPGAPTGQGRVARRCVGGIELLGQRELPPFIPSLEGDGDPAVFTLRSVHTLVENPRIGVPEPRRWRAGRKGVAHLLHTQLIHRCVDVTASLLRMTTFERRDDSRRHREWQDDVAIGCRAGYHRVAVRPAGQQGAAAERGSRSVDSPAARHGAGLSIHAAGNHDEARIARGELRIIQA